MSDDELTDLYQKTDLEDRADIDAIEHTPGYPPKRSTILQQTIGLSEDEIEVRSTGGWQGTMLFVFQLDGYLWLLKDSYGSCSYCDGLLGADHASEYATTMMRDAYAFEDSNDAVRYLHAKDGEQYAYGWGQFIDDGIAAIQEVTDDGT